MTLECEIEKMQKGFDAEVDDLRKTNSAIILQANYELKKGGLDILKEEFLGHQSTDELGRPLPGVLNYDNAETLHDQNLLVAKDLEIVELENHIRELLENKNEIVPCVVDIFQSGDGSREKLRQKAIAQWKEHYYLNEKRGHEVDDEQFLDDNVAPILKRSNSQRIRNTRDEVFFDMQERLTHLVHNREVEIHQIQKDFDDRVEALTVDMSILRSQLPSNKYKSTKKF